MYDDRKLNKAIQGALGSENASKVYEQLKPALKELKKNSVDADDFSRDLKNKLSGKFEVTTIEKIANLATSDFEKERAKPKGIKAIVGKFTSMLAKRKEQAKGKGQGIG